METHLANVADSITKLILESENNIVGIESIVGPEPVVKTAVGDSVKFTMYAEQGRLTYTVTITAKYESEED